MTITEFDDVLTLSINYHKGIALIYETIIYSIIAEVHYITYGFHNYIMLW